MLTSARRKVVRFVSEQIIGWLAIAAFVVELLSPSLLSIELTMAGGLAGFGFLLVTDRADYVVDRILKGLREML